MKPAPFFLISLLFLFSSHITAQSTWTVKGTVKDAETGEPIIGASVVQPRERIGVATDAAGKFSLLVKKPSDSLLVRYAGYNEQWVVYRPGHYELAVRLMASSTEPDTVVIVESPAASDVEMVVGHSKIESRDFSATTMWSARGKGAAKKREAKEFSPSATYATAIVAKPSASAGLLTAGELNDFSKWALWEDIDSTDLAIHRGAWKMYPSQRYVVQVQTPGGFPVVDAKVKLENKAGKVIWSAHTDNTGKAELWYQPFSAEDAKNPKLKIQVGHAGAAEVVEEAKAFQQGINSVTLNVSCEPPRGVDIAFVVDATSSMSDEIAYLQAELRDIIKKAQATLSDQELRLASVFYRDKGDEYVTRKTPFSSKISEVDKFIAGQSAAGGGDFPEAVDEGMKVALKELNWDENATARILFLVLDAPPHDDKAKEMQELSELAAAMGVRIVPVVASGINKSAEYLFRSMALLSNGTYVFLTDDSGIGGSHIKPTTDKWEVETLNELLLRIIFQYTQTVDCQVEMAVTQPETLVVLPPDSTSAASAEGPIRSHEQGYTSDKDWETAGKDAKITWKYWPNPTSGPLDIEVNGKKEGMLFLTDLAGKLLQRQEISESGKLHLELARYPAGTYYLKCQYDDDHWLSGKVVVVK